MKRRTLFYGALAVSVLLSPSLIAAEDGAAQYQKNCIVCHGANGAGKTPAQKKMPVPDLREKEFVQMSDAALYDTIAKGTKHKTYPHTFPYTGMSEAQVQSVVAHIRKLQKPPAK